MYKIFRLLLFMLLPLLWACSEDIVEQREPSTRQRRLVLDGSFLAYGPDTRAGSISFPKDAVMYLQLGDARTVAVFDGTEWTLTLPDGLSDDASGVCTAYYFEQAVTSLSSVTLSSASAIYQGVGSFTNSMDALTVSATVRPVLARLHFRGAVGASITVSGLEGYSAFLPSSFTFTESAQPLSLTVQADGYTPYVYAMLAADRTLTVSDGTFTFTRTFASSVMQAGESGFLDIPTRTSHTGWSSDEQSDVTLDGNEYGSDSNWNQADKEPTKNLDVSGTDFDGDSNWNQADKEPSKEVDAGKEDYDGDSNWNQADKEPTKEVDAGKEDYDGDKDWNQSDPDTNHDYVDLGIIDSKGAPIYWATCNVGANSPDEYGDYFAWGETSTKSDYSWDTYTYCKDGSKTSLTKYCVSSNYGTVDNKTTLDPADDVAHVKWGEGWRMPTDDEFAKLRNECKWRWVSSYNGIQVNGYTITGKKEGYTDKTIFIPAAGYYEGTELKSTSISGAYWSSSLYSGGYNYYAYSLTINNAQWVKNRYYRCNGLTIRPVCQ